MAIGGVGVGTRLVRVLCGLVVAAAAGCGSGGSSGSGARLHEGSALDASASGGSSSGASSSGGSARAQRAVARRPTATTAATLRATTRPPAETLRAATDPAAAAGRVLVLRPREQHGEPAGLRGRLDCRGLPVELQRRELPHDLRRDGPDGQRPPVRRARPDRLQQGQARPGRSSASMASRRTPSCSAWTPAWRGPRRPMPGGLRRHHAQRLHEQLERRDLLRRRGHRGARRRLADARDLRRGGQAREHRSPPRLRDRPLERRLHELPARLRGVGPLRRRRAERGRRRARRPSAAEPGRPRTSRPALRPTRFPSSTSMARPTR